MTSLEFRGAYLGKWEWLVHAEKAKDEWRGMERSRDPRRGER